MQVLLHNVAIIVEIEHIVEAHHLLLRLPLLLLLPWYANGDDDVLRFVVGILDNQLYHLMLLTLHLLLQLHLLMMLFHLLQ